MKNFLLGLWRIEGHIRTHIAFTHWLLMHIPILGKVIGMLMDRLILFFYGIDMMSTSINVKKLSIAHPNGILLGGNGIFSCGRVAIMAGVKFVGRSPNNEEYLRRQKEGRVFDLGDNVVIGANSAIVGPVRICDNVIIGAMSMVNKDITESGVYVGSPATKISEIVTEEWVSHL